jgi:hypothetical protein
MRVVGGNIYVAGMLKGVLNHLMCGIIEDEVGFESASRPCVELGGLMANN